MIKKRYLGDSVYVEFDSFSNLVVLTTDNGLGPTNTIYLEENTFRGLKSFVEDMNSGVDNEDDESY